MHRDHRNVRQPGHRLRARAVLGQRLQHQHHRNGVAAVLDQHREARRPGQPPADLRLRLVGAGAATGPSGNPVSAWRAAFAALHNRAMAATSVRPAVRGTSTTPP
jgi:hypothetical protein